MVERTAPTLSTRRVAICRHALLTAKLDPGQHGASVHENAVVVSREATERWRRGLHMVAGDVATCLVFAAATPTYVVLSVQD